MSTENPHIDWFNPLVWEIVRQIPSGEVATYGQIAGMIPTPEGIDAADYARLGPRWVGDAMNAVSAVDEPTTPWHRVINARGGISLPPESRAAKTQRIRLEAEGVVFGKKDTCSLETFGWNGPDTTWLDARGLLTPRPLRKPVDDGGQMKLF